MNTERAWQGCVFIGTSLDGYIAGPDNELTWLTDPTPRAHVTETTAHPALVWETFYPTVDTLVMGRITYETILGFDTWPFHGKHVIVLSTTLASNDKVTAVRSVTEAHQLLKAEKASRVYVDGGRTIQAFMAAGLIDEITVAISPILLGKGHRLFGDLDENILLTLRGHHSTQDGGLLRATYDLTKQKTDQKTSQKAGRP